ncbi:hypothetical protein ICN33_09095 [Polynucleobacter sp. UB-Tiil-W10]|nr:hypothetical protein [Polynucleobacter sp. UB-Tiil-W10]
MNPLVEQIQKLVNIHLDRILASAEVGLPTQHQFLALRKVALDEFGKKGLLPELELLIKRHYGSDIGRANTARKEVPYE